MQSEGVCQISRPVSDISACASKVSTGDYIIRTSCTSKGQQMTLNSPLILQIQNENKRLTNYLSPCTTQFDIFRCFLVVTLTIYTSEHFIWISWPFNIHLSFLEMVAGRQRSEMLLYRFEVRFRKSEHYKAMTSMSSSWRYEAYYVAMLADCRYPL